MLNKDFLLELLSIYDQLIDIINNTNKYFGLAVISFYSVNIHISHSLLLKLQITNILKVLGASVNIFSGFLTTINVLFGQHYFSIVKKIPRTLLISFECIHSHL